MRLTKTLIAACLGLTLSGPAPAATRSLVMLDQTNNPVSDIQLGDYEFAFLMSNGDYLGMRRSTGQLERIFSPDRYSFRARYSFRSMLDTTPTRDVVDLPGFSVIGASGVGFAGAIPTGIQEDFTAQGYVRGKMSPNDYNDRTFLDSASWFKDVPLPNLRSTIRVALTGFFTTAITRAGSANAQVGAFHGVSNTIGGTCQTNAACFVTHNEQHVSFVENGKNYFYPAYDSTTAYTYGMNVPALDALRPLTFGTKRIRAVIPPTQIVIAGRTVRHSNSALFFRSCLAVSEERRGVVTASDSDTEMVKEYRSAPTAAGGYGIYLVCSTNGTSPRSITSPSAGGTIETARVTTNLNPLSDNFFCNGDLDDLRCGILYGASFYQASTDLRSLSYLWRGQFYLVDTLSNEPRSKITIPDGVVPVKFFGYVGNL